MHMSFLYKEYQRKIQHLFILIQKNNYVSKKISSEPVLVLLSCHNLL